MSLADDLVRVESLAELLESETATLNAMVFGRLEESDDPGDLIRREETAATAAAELEDAVRSLPRERWEAYLQDHLRALLGLRATSAEPPPHLDLLIADLRSVIAGDHRTLSWVVAGCVKLRTPDPR